MSGVFVTGHMRSGTSMVAGLFAQHGVFFGDCPERRAFNEKGTYENRWLKDTLDNDKRHDEWPDAWFHRLEWEGWDGESPWGAKAVAVHWERMKQTEPDVVVLCYRPKEAILDSCEAFSSADRHSREHRGPVIDEHWRIMDEIYEHYRGVVVKVDTPTIIDGQYREIEPAFRVLDVPFQTSIANEWVDPELWHHE